ncbi:glycosyltransferase family 4 protein [Azospirillum sp. TSO22-1]|uniref:glycosyltransferase family 4 protein n=1 Tax=Azospirillum sp. TSO22-1 TaxID=716789 RepID=UPI000D60A99F|nr:glycosyltransferase family 4 protein [Azospirillum sp. TSO22-1]PWC52980.1 hypothetical protein TSO221_12140 [Azospirillum sp. TSO22-1]
MRIAIFDYLVTETNPVGRCHLTLLRRLCDEHEFVVFAVAFDNPRPDRIRFVRVPAPPRPLALLFVAFHLLAPLALLVARLRGTPRFDCIQSVESNFGFPGIAYAHFCHRAYLNAHWKAARPSGLRRMARWLDHWLHAVAEPSAFRRAKLVVVPSRGLAAELSRQYPWVDSKLRILANPVDTGHFTPPADFDRQRARSGHGYTEDDVVLCFVALGHFERKGLPPLIDAMARLADRRLRLLVVGGTDATVRDWTRRVAAAGLAHAVRFAGMQKDVRPCLWSADAFVLPSFYEVYPLAGLQAAAAKLPLIVTAVYGLEEVLRDGENGLLLEPTTDGLARALGRFLALSPAERRSMGEAAARTVTGCGEEPFAERWRSLYRQWGASA